MARKLTSVVLVLCLLVTILPAAAAETVHGTCGKDGDGSGVTWSFSDGVLTISGKGEMADYYWGSDHKPAAPWRLYQEELFEVVIEPGVTSIGNSAFSECINLDSVAIPESVISIGDYAFFTCVSLTHIKIPASVTSIGFSAFLNCQINLTAIDISEDNPNYASEEGVLFNKDKTELICYPAGRVGTYAVPEGVTAIGELAFFSCRWLSSIILPEGLTTIKNSAFDACDDLVSIAIPKSVTTIEDWAFYDCMELKEVYYGGSEAQWKKITVGDGNENLMDATIHYQGHGEAQSTVGLRMCLSVNIFLAQWLGRGAWNRGSAR